MSKAPAHIESPNFENLQVSQLICTLPTAVNFLKAVATNFRFFVFCITCFFFTFCIRWSRSSFAKMFIYGVILYTNDVIFP